MKEIWKDIKGFEGKYQISNYGRIMSFARYSRGVLINPKHDKDGYLEIGLSNGSRGNCIYKRVHRLVAEAFIENPKNLPIINHKNGVRDDNRVDNLEWCNNSHNQLHRCHVNNNPPNNEYKKRKVESKNILTNESMIFDSIKECAKFYSVTPTAIQRRLMGKIANPTTSSKKSMLNNIKISYVD